MSQYPALSTPQPRSTTFDAGSKPFMSSKISCWRPAFSKPAIGTPKNFELSRRSARCCIVDIAIRHDHTRRCGPETLLAMSAIRGGGSKSKFLELPNYPVRPGTWETNQTGSLYDNDVAERRHLRLHLLVIAHDHDRAAVRVEVLRRGLLDVGRGQLVDLLAERLQEIAGQVVDVERADAPREAGL